MISKKLAGIICAIITFIVGLLLDEVAIRPMVEAIHQALPCPEGNLAQACANSKLALLFAPYLGTFGSLFVLLRRLGGDQN